MRNLTRNSLGVELVSICDSLDTTSPTGRAMFKMIGVIAELEREMIVERTKAGLVPRSINCFNLKSVAML